MDRMNHKWTKSSFCVNLKTVSLNQFVLISNPSVLGCTAWPNERNQCRKKNDLLWKWCYQLKSVSIRLVEHVRHTCTAVTIESIEKHRQIRKTQFFENARKMHTWMSGCVLHHKHTQMSVLCTDKTKKNCVWSLYFAVVPKRKQTKLKFD